MNLIRYTTFILLDSTQHPPYVGADFNMLGKSR
ncbi:uncharacterized protein METZ01_LOCUS333244 [marine metagenome]|uniref:Uncharacterized protein n=1 Tax=marine metagenome TaxID=408172 RepID=A0A382Q5Y9_9ZZZZ